MFKKDDKVKVVKGIKAFEGLTGTVLDTNGNQVKVKLNLSDDSELQKNLINVFEDYQLELESLDLLKEETVSFDNDVDEKQVCCICGEEYEGYGNNAEPYKEGRCCDKCNMQFVIPDRLKRLRNPKNESLKSKYYKYFNKDRLVQIYNKAYSEMRRIAKDNHEADWTVSFENKIDRIDNNLNLKQASEKEILQALDKFAKLLKQEGLCEYSNDAYYELFGCTDKEYAMFCDDYSEEDYLEESKNLRLTESELKAWCSDHDANYYTQDIKDDKVIIRGLNEDLAEYDFKTKELKVFDYSGTTVDENELDEAEDDDNYIRDYVYDIDMIDEKTEIPSWEFASIIATAEDTTEEAVVTEAHDRGFKVYLITASNYEKLVIASEKITEDDIMDDFAAYLEGNPKVTEVI